MEKDVYEVGYRVAVREPEHLRSYPFYGRIPVAICSSASCGNRAGAFLLSQRGIPDQLKKQPDN